MAQSLEAKPLMACHIGLEKQTFHDGVLALRLSIIYHYRSKGPSVSITFFLIGKDGSLKGMAQHCFAQCVCFCMCVSVCVSGVICILSVS